MIQLAPHCFSIGECKHTDPNEVFIRIATLAQNLPEVKLGSLEQEGSIVFRNWEANEKAHLAFHSPEYSMADHVARDGWHRDRNMGGEAPYVALILWSNQQPTELKSSEGIEFQPLPCTVVLLHNMWFLHRPPKEIKPGRLFFRAMIKLPSWL